ncbi:unnamed protein product, partial [Heterotrigona itama]
TRYLGRIPRCLRTDALQQPITMDVFEKQYNSYRIVSRIVGLWPFQNSIYTMIKRIFLCISFIAVSVIQIMSLLNSEITLQKCVLTLSMTFPSVLFFLRYINFIILSSDFRVCIDQIRMEEALLHDLIEIRILRKYFNDGSRLFNLFINRSSQILGLFCTGIVVFTSSLLTPIMMDFVKPRNESRTRLIKYFTEFSHKQTIYVDIFSLGFIFIITIGVLSTTCTESMLNIVAHYLSGLFKITSYRLQKIIMNLCNTTSSSQQIDLNLMDFRRAVDIHNKALMLFSKSMTPVNDGMEIFVCFVLVVIYLVIMFLNNYSGQLVINTSTDIFIELYNSTWYYIPLKAQKLLLFIMLKSSQQYEFNLSGLFAPCYEGFLT